MILAFGLLIIHLVGWIELLSIPMNVEYLHESVTDHRILWKSLKYSDQKVLQLLPTLLSTELSIPLRKAYSITSLKISDALIIYREFILRKELHELVLPLSFIISNPILLSILAAIDWGQYQVGILSTPSHVIDFLQERSWKNEMLNRVVQHSKESNPKIADIATWELTMILSGFHPQKLSELKRWRGPLLALIHSISAFSIGDLSLLTEFNIFLAQSTCPELSFALGVELDSEGEVLEDFPGRMAICRLIVFGDITVFQELLESVQLALISKSQIHLALWHGKLIFATIYAMEMPTESQGQLIKVLEDYFCAYEVENYYSNLVGKLTTAIVQSNLKFSESNKLFTYNSKILNQIHSNFPLVTGTRDEYLERWRSMQKSSGIFTPSPSIHDWWEALRELSNRHPRKGSEAIIFSRDFQGRFRWADLDGNVTECVNVYCLLEKLPEFLLQPTIGLFKRMPLGGGTLFSNFTSRITPEMWRGVGVLITLGLFFLGKDPFNLTLRTWILLADPPDRARHYKSAGAILHGTGLFSSVPLWALSPEPDIG